MRRALDLMWTNNNRNAVNKSLILSRSCSWIYVLRLTAVAAWLSLRKTTKPVASRSPHTFSLGCAPIGDDHDRIIGQPQALYIHIPFCRQRCRYCDFAIVPIGRHHRKQEHTDGTDLEAVYTQALLRELKALQSSFQHEMTSPTVKTIYFGGGTPSLARASTIESILQHVYSVFLVDHNSVEITMEMDPGTFDSSYLRRIQQAGVNRISLGAQAAHDGTLQRLGRTHTRADIDTSVQLLRDYNISNISIDLITGIPGVSAAEWMETLETAIHTWKPEHLSIYDLQIEPGTAFGRWYGDDATTILTTRPALPSPRLAAFLYQYTAGYLRHYGWEHYEVSSYAASHDMRSRHNQMYWDYNASWYAIGLGATSSVDGYRRKRPRAMADYVTWANEGCQEEKLETDNDTEFWTELVMQRLRTSDGLSLDRIGDMAIVDAITKGAELALELGLAHRIGNTLRLADPKGFLYSNTIISTIVVELERCQSLKTI